MGSKTTSIIMTCLRVLFVATLLPLATAASASYYWWPYTYVNTVGMPYGYGWYPTYYWPQIWYDWGYNSPYYWGDLNNFGVSYYPTYRYIPTYAVISYSPSTNRFGSAWGQRSIYSARGRAQDYCAAADCKAVVWTQGGCASISVAVKTAAGADLPPTQKHVYWGVNTDRQGAVNNAQTVCTNHQGTFGANAGQCESMAWVCSW